jgi:hypothetical protein
MKVSDTNTDFIRIKHEHFASNNCIYLPHTQPRIASRSSTEAVFMSRNRWTTRVALVVYRGSYISSKTRTKIDDVTVVTYDQGEGRGLDGMRRGMSPGAPYLPYMLIHVDIYWCIKAVLSYFNMSFCYGEKNL